MLSIVKLYTSGAPVNDDVKDWVEKIIENSTSEIYLLPYVAIYANKNLDIKM